jgi:hypothetical protein
VPWQAEATNLHGGCVGTCARHAAPVTPAARLCKRQPLVAILCTRQRCSYERRCRCCDGGGAGARCVQDEWPGCRSRPKRRAVRLCFIGRRAAAWLLCAWCRWRTGGGWAVTICLAVALASSGAAGDGCPTSVHPGPSFSSLGGARRLLAGTPRLPTRRPPTFGAGAEGRPCERFLRTGITGL